MLSRLKHWLLFNYRYVQRRKLPWDTGISPPELLAYIASHAPGRALDLGCGTGTNVLTLVERGWDVTGVDFAVQALAQARRKLQQAHLQADLCVADVTRVALPGPFDLILDIGCFHGLPHPEQDRYADQVKGWLASRGTFLIYVQWRQTADQRSGIDDADLARFAPLVLTQRVDGIDTARVRPSAWLTFMRERSGA